VHPIFVIEVCARTTCWNTILSVLRECSYNQLTTFT